MTRINYEVVFDHDRTTIQETDQPADRVTIFKRFEDARRAAIDGIDAEMTDLNQAMRRIARMEKADR